MSYPSVTEIAKEKHIFIPTASEEQLEAILWEAIQRDLPEGVAYLKGMAAEVKRTGRRVLKVENHSPVLIGHFNRLLGTNVARTILQKKLGVAFGYYNCHYPVAAPDEEALDISLTEQINLQNGVIATVDC